MPVTVKQTPLAIGGRATPEETEKLSNSFGMIDKSYMEDYSTTYGGHDASLDYLLESNDLRDWKDCLGDVTSDYATSLWKNPVMYFPATWRTPEEVEKWCGFLNDRLNFHCRYLGEGWISTRKYHSPYNFTDKRSKVRSHVIVMEYQHDLYSTCPKAVLAKVSLIRYIYRTNHFETLIKPLYTMLENDAVSPWDALFFAHYYGFSNGMEYQSGRGLFYFNTDTFPIMYPRSYEDVKNFFKKFQYINKVWSPGHLNNVTFLYNHYQETNILTSDFYANLDYPFHYAKDLEENDDDEKIDQYFTNPHAWSARNKFNDALRNKEWNNAYEIYYSVLASVRPMIQAIKNDPDGFIRFTERPFKSEGGHTESPNYKSANYIKDILQFISTFEP